MSTAKWRKADFRRDECCHQIRRFRWGVSCAAKLLRAHGGGHPRGHQFRACSSLRQLLLHKWWVYFVFQTTLFGMFHRLTQGHCHPSCLNSDRSFAHPPASTAEWPRTLRLWRDVLHGHSLGWGMHFLTKACVFSETLLSNVHSRVGCY